MAGTSAREPDVGRDRDDAAVAAAADELGEHPDLAGRAVVDDRPVEPRDERVRRPEPFAVDAVDVLERDVRELREVLVRHEAVEALRAEAGGESVEPGAFGLG